MAFLRQLFLYRRAVRHGPRAKNARRDSASANIELSIKADLCATPLSARINVINTAQTQGGTPAGPGNGGAWGAGGAGSGPGGLGQLEELVQVASRLKG